MFPNCDTFKSWEQILLAEKRLKRTVFCKDVQMDSNGQKPSLFFKEETGSRNQSSVKLSWNWWLYVKASPGRQSQLIEMKGTGANVFYAPFLGAN